MDLEMFQFCLMGGLAFAGVIVFAYVSKLREIRRARNWLQTTGRVTKSQVRAIKRTDVDGASNFENEPLVTYEYTVNSKAHRGTRVNFADRIGGSDVGETLARYPVNKIVTVFYNPNNPKEAVLERDFPRIVHVAIGIIIAVILGAAILIPLAINLTILGITPVLPDPGIAAFVTLLSFMGLFVLLLAFAVQRQVWAAKNWRVASGKILASDMEEYQQWESERGRSRQRTLYRSSVVYKFTVNGQQYINDEITLGAKMSVSIPGMVQGATDKYPPGKTVQVYYNPDNPTESALELRAGGVWFFLIVALSLFAFAFWASGIGRVG